MKRQLTAIGMAMTLGAGGVVSAQSDGMGKGQMDKGMMKDGQMTMSGCVAAGKDAGQYMLTNAMMMAGGMMDKGMMDRMEKDKMAGMSDKDMKAMKLNVKSVKMVSASCP